MERRTKKSIICLSLSCYLLVSNILIARAEALPDVANGSATIADCVMSYYAMAGSAIANTDWINTLYDGLGSSFGTVYDFAEAGMLTINNDGTWQATSELTQEIANNSTYLSLGLDQVFNVSAEEVAAGGGVAVASGAATLSGAIGSVASTGVLPVLGGVTAAYWGGIALGTLANHLVDKIGRAITNSNPITYSDYLNSLPAGTGTYCFYSPTKRFCLSVVGEPFGVLIESDNYVRVIVQSPETSGRIEWIVWNLTNNKQSQKNYSTITNNFGTSFGGHVSEYMYLPYDYSVSDQTAFNNYISDLRNRNKTKPNNYSPDVIGSNGNQQGSYDPNTGYQVPDIKPMIDPGTQAGVPLSLQDWLNFANSVINNNSNSNPLPDNTSLYDAIMDRVVRTTTPDPNPNPNPDPDPDPYTPPVVTPVPDPDYDPDPSNPEQPDYESEKQKQTEDIPDEVPTGAPWTTDGLIDKFPFCIPKDLIDMAKQFSSGTRQAPHISWRFNPPNTNFDYTFNLDLSDFEEVATLLRMLELAAFVVGLAFATRYLIGAS